MSDTFLVGLDEGDCSTRALEFAVQRAKSASAKLIVAYVIEWSPFSFNTPEENAERHKRREQEIASAQNAVVQPTLDKLAKLNIEAEGQVRHGNVAQVLNDLAMEANASQLIVGRIGGSGLKSMLFGSVSAKLVQIADVPITVVP